MHLGMYTVSRQLAEVQNEHQSGEDGRLNDFESGMVVGARRACPSLRN